MTARNIILATVLVVMIGLYPVQVVRAVHNCRTINAGRVQGNVRADVLRQTLHRLGYDDLASRVKDLPLQDCLVP